MSRDRPIGDLTLTSLRGGPPNTRQGEGALLAVLEGPQVGRAVLVQDGTVAVGSGVECDFVLTDRTVSRRHLEARWMGRGEVELCDLDSKNGSFYAGRKFQRITVGFGDEFRAGTTLFKVLPVEEAISADASGGGNFGNLVGDSPAMRRLFGLLAQVASSRAPVLIEGETGCGKELVTEELHRRSARRDGPLVVFDCGAVPSELIESLLFGHVRGAFTGATSDRPGVFVEASGGTLFLDEIGELALDLQTSLLRAVDRGTVRPVGGNVNRQVDVRVVAATHRSLAEMVSSGQFREDLYYRLAVVRLSVPPMRERMEDIPLLLRHFARRLGRPELADDESLVASLMAHDWPGNVRELRNAVERVVALSPAGEPPMIDWKGTAAPAPVRSNSSPSQPGIQRNRTRQTFRDAKAAAMEEFEARYLAELIADHPTVTAAAQAAGMDRKHLRVLLRRYGLGPEA